jgi:hypothetical protein
MFSLATGIYQSYFAPPKLSILIVGLDNSGKTALLERIKVTNFSNRVDHTSSHGDKCVVGAVAGANLDDEALMRGARPARLPPPLPPKKAMESRKNVDQVLAAEERLNTPGHNQHHTNNERDDLLQGIPPPPLCGFDISEISNGTGGPADTTKSTLTTTQSKSNDSQRPPLPPQPGLSKPHHNSQTPTTATPYTRSSFIQLLRCPSPQRYSSSALGEEEDEYYRDAIHASALDAIATSAQKQQKQVQEEEEWNTDYLKDYYINYQDGEEFDVKVLNGKKSKIFPLERIRPTLGQNLAKVDICGCKCSLFDLSGAVSLLVLVSTPL